MHTWESARQLAARGHTVILAANRRREQPAEEVRDGVTIYRQHLSLLGQKAPLRWISNWRRLLATNPDVVLERYITLGGAGALMARYHNIPLVLEVNSPHVEEVIHRWHIPSLLQAPLLEWRNFQFRWSALAFSPLPGIVPDWFRERSRKILWGVDVHAFRPDLAATPRVRELEAKYGLGGRQVLLFVGSFLPWQGAKHLPAILKQITRECPQVKLVAVGAGWEDREVNATMQKLGLGDNFIATGRISHGDIPYLCNLARVGLAPFDISVYNPLVKHGFFWAPSKVLEYLASGLAVVASDYPLLRELLGEGERGSLVPPGDDGAFANAVVELLQHPEMVGEMGRKGRHYAEVELAWEEHARILEGYLQEGIRLGAWARRRWR